MLPNAVVMGSACAGMEGCSGGMLREVEAVSCLLTSLGVRAPRWKARSGCLGSGSQEPQAWALLWPWAP